MTKLISDAVAVSIQRRFRRPVLAWLYLARLFNRLDKLHNRVLAEFGLSHAQFDVLSQLQARPGLSQQQLAQRMLVTKGNVCGLIDRMEREAWVERRPNRDDRRVNDLHLTERGRQLFLRAAPEIEAAVAAMFSPLDQAELVHLTTLLGRLDREQRQWQPPG